jgi:hypothetical protein
MTHRGIEAVMRYRAVLLVLFFVTGCAEPVTVQNPRTGQTVLCKTAADEWNPYSQADECVSDHLSQGWTIVR